MTISEAIARLHVTSDEAVICAKRPWRPSTECVVTGLDARGRVPESVLNAGFEYFLEVSTAREVLAVFGEGTPTHQEQVEAILFYAENDAYPDWVFEARRPR